MHRRGEIHDLWSAQDILWPSNENRIYFQRNSMISAMIPVRYAYLLALILCFGIHYQALLCAGLTSVLVNDRCAVAGNRRGVWRGAVTSAVSRATYASYRTSTWIKMSFHFEEIPNDILQLLLSYFAIPDLLSFRAVNRKWKTMISLVLICPKCDPSPITRHLI